MIVTQKGNTFYRAIASRHLNRSSQVKGWAAFHTGEDRWRKVEREGYEEADKAKGIKELERKLQ